MMHEKNDESGFRRERNDWIIILVHPIIIKIHKRFDALKRFSQLTLKMDYQN